MRGIVVVVVLFLAVFLSLGEGKDYHADLSGGAERPDPVETDASGDADLFFNSENRELEVRINHNLPALAAAHIHGPADRDNTGGVLHEFDITEGEANDPITQTFTLTEDEETFLRNGEMYINLHTEDHPDGELRGQVEEGEGSDDDDDNTDIIIWVSVALGGVAIVAVIGFVIFFKAKKSSGPKMDVPSKAGSGGYKPQQDFA